MVQGIEKLTPMMKQYLEIKSSYEDSILFFRLGDFYEMFFEDAVKASSILNIALTSRNKNSKNPVPLCGIPHHSSKNYIAKLVKAGCKVAVCEQVEDPKEAQGVVKREVVQVVTPGLFLDLENLDSNQPNFLLCLSLTGKEFHLAALDILTGECACGIFYKYDDFINEICKFSASEVLFIEGKQRIEKEIHAFFPNARIEERKKVDQFDLESANPEFTDSYYRLGVDLDSESIYSTLNTLLQYASLVGRKALSHLTRVQLLKNKTYLSIDNRTARHLELLQNNQDRGRHGTLFWVLNKTKTPMGARLLRKWILFPLMNLVDINLRLDAVEEWVENYSLIEEFQNLISGMGDLERVIGRLATGTAHPKDLAQIRGNIKLISQFKIHYQNKFQSKLLKNAIDAIPEFDDLTSQLESSLVEDPPFTVREGGIIKEGYHLEVDELKKLSREGKTTIAELESREREKTGISVLKIKYNRVFGYYIEITNAHKDKAPAHYIRKQTLSNAERYITEELKEFETKVLGALDRLKTLEYSLFEELRDSVFKYIPQLKKASDQLALVDVLVSLASQSLEANYIRPHLTQNKDIKISGLRHPVLEKIMGSDKFIPNDIEMKGDEAPVFLITGPNMAGKSTVMRQLALGSLMAQMGSFIPADQAQIGLVDSIMSRIGANDDLSQGMSTFMVEMLETSQILARATDRSLLLLDEIGRGTSTYDGLAIAWAILKNIDENLKCRTLFSTHYHELTEMSGNSSSILNYHIAVKEFQGELVFLRKLVGGACSRSYGIDVAQLAGLPDEIIREARKKLKSLEQDSLKKESNKNSHGQFDLFVENKEKNELASEVLDLDLNSLTPLQALNWLNEFQAKVKKDEF